MPGLKEKLSPLGVPAADRATPPENPSRLVTVIVVDPELFGANLREVGVAEMEKSETLTVTITDAEVVPLLPVTLTL